MNNEKEILKKENCRTDNSGQFEAVVSLRPELLNKIHLGDSFEFLEGCPPNVFDLILEDMPYNITACDWDVKIDLELYWKTRLRALKPTGCIVLTASQPFTSELVMSNRKMFKYEMIWKKSMPTGMALAKQRPMKYHENILIFYNGKTTFNKIMKERSEVGKERLKNSGKILNGSKHKSQHISKAKLAGTYSEYDINFVNPGSILEFGSVPNCNGTKLHPTQKPVGLFEYLIRTYTNEGELVFDGFGGSGTTAIAAYKSNRNFIVVEKEKKYFELSQKRLAEEVKQYRLF